MKLTVAPAGASFLDSPVETDLDRLEADFAVVGIPFGVPYTMQGFAPSSSRAPQAIRERSKRYGAFRHHYDFDRNGEMLPADVRVVDVGDVAADPRDLEGNRQRATAAVKKILDRSAVPVVLGGDDSTSALAFLAYEGHGPITIVQIDAHIDYREEVGGERWGYSSPMRRAAEMAWVSKIVHVGTRGVGSARREDVEATLKDGNVIVTAREVHDQGVEAILRHLPEGGKYYLHVDVDGFDPSVMPKVSAALPGGLTYWHGLDLIRGMQQRGTIAGIGFVELEPEFDTNGLSALAVTRLILAAMAPAEER